MGKLELLTDSVLFDRNNKIAVLSAAGRALLPEVRRLVDDADALAVRARRFAAGVEPRLAVCIDAVFPVSGVVAVAKAFADVELALFTESLSAVTAGARVLCRSCTEPTHKRHERWALAKTPHGAQCAHGDEDSAFATLV